MEELNEKLAKWAGFYIKKCPYETMWGRAIETRWIHADCYNEHEPPVYFTHSFDACFGWLIPKLRHQITLKNIKEGWHCMLYGESPPRIEAIAETPALALCKAIEKLIDG